MDVLRTAPERFADLPGYAFRPNMISVESGLEMHYVDEGDRSGAPILLLHGEPSWSYLYRKMVPILAAAGHRAIAPDLIGFGKSDKPADRREYTYARHVAWVRALVEGLDLRGITLFCQDWGSLIGLRLAAEHEDRFARIVVANGALPTGEGAPSPAFRVWRAFARYSPVFPVGRLVATGCVGKLSREVRRAYDAPFPTHGHKAGALAFPQLVPTQPGDPATAANRSAWAVLERWEKPFLTLYGKNDPILGRADAAFQRRVPGARAQPHERFWGGHFVQEDRGDYLANAVVTWMRRPAS